MEPDEVPVVVLGDGGTYDADLLNCNIELWTNAGLEQATKTAEAIDQDSKDMLKRWNLFSFRDMFDYANWLKEKWDAR